MDTKLCTGNISNIVLRVSNNVIVRNTISLDIKGDPSNLGTKMLQNTTKSSLILPKPFDFNS